MAPHKNELVRSILFGAVLFSLILFGSKPSLKDPSLGIAIQHNGQVKSFDAFCRETVQTITGKQKWDHRSPESAVFRVLRDNNAAGDLKWIRIDLPELISKIGLVQGQVFYSYNQVIPSIGEVQWLVQEARNKRDKDLRPTKLEQAAETLYGKLSIAKDLMSGDSINVIPPKEGKVWSSPYASEGSRSDEFRKLVSLSAPGKENDFREGCKKWIEQTNHDTASAFRAKIKRELIYFSLRPFQWAWILYLVSFIFLSFFKKKNFGILIGLASVFCAFALHTDGLILRVLILGRPPVSNMYESMIYMSWVVMAVAVIFSLTNKNLVFISSASMISALVVIYGNLLPLDPSLEVLVPVLRSNYWLTIHVLTIVSSYGVFGVAMALGHRHLILSMLGKLPKSAEQTSAQLIYRVIQLGVLLIGIGTTLGGVWANESWGRFWGWDPKETWALITLLGYLVVIHLKYSKLISNFWLAMSAVLGFLLVLMTWYGVNFVLGRGLHSYGFGSGGIVWIFYYLGFEFIFVTAVFYRNFSHKNA